MASKKSQATEKKPKNSPQLWVRYQGTEQFSGKWPEGDSDKAIN